ncbi:uncharacterized protein LOC144357858 [Saccoglossus kowalevskii]
MMRLRTMDTSVLMCAVLLWVLPYLQVNGQETDTAVVDFVITGPPNITYGIEPTVVTFSLKISATLHDSTINSVQLYFASEDRHPLYPMLHTETFPCDTISVHLGDEQYINGTSEIDSVHCFRYSYMCVIIATTEDDDNLSNNFMCEYVDRNKFNCPGNQLFN